MGGSRVAIIAAGGTDLYCHSEPPLTSGKLCFIINFIGGHRGARTGPEFANSQRIQTSVSQMTDGEGEASKRREECASKWQVGVSGAQCLVAGFFLNHSNIIVEVACNETRPVPATVVIRRRCNLFTIDARSGHGAAGNLRCSRSVPSSTLGWLGAGRVGSYPTASSGSYRLLTFDRSCRRRHRPS